MSLTLWDIHDMAPPDDFGHVRQIAAADYALRPYQSGAVDAACKVLGFMRLGKDETIEPSKSALLVMPTGTGKTVVFSHVAAHVPGRVMVLAHRRELIDQSARKLQDVTGDTVEVEMGYRRATRHGGAKIVVSSIQTQCSGARIEKFRPDDFDLLIIDEAHHAVADTYRRTIDWYRQNPRLRVLGVTATPDRTDEAALGKVFDSVPFVYELPDAIRDGWLAPIRQRLVDAKAIDLSTVGNVAGDLNAGQLARVMETEKALYEIAEPTYELAENRKTIIFAVRVEHAEKIAHILNAKEKDCARSVSGATPEAERAELFRDYREGRFRFLVNVGIATEGFDEPGIEVVAIARPTKSRALYAQAVGRGTRPLPGIVDKYDDAAARRRGIELSPKPFCEVIDFVGNAAKHKLVTTADILGGNYEDEVVERAKRIVEKSDQPVDMQAALDKAVEDVKEDRRRRHEEEVAKRRQIRANVRHSSQWLDPFDIFDMAPVRERGWQVEKQPTERMRAMLERNGFDPNMTYAQAMGVIDQIRSHPERLPATKGMARALKYHGAWRDGMTKAEAGKEIARLKATGEWRW